MSLSIIVAKRLKQIRPALSCWLLILSACAGPAPKRFPAVWSSELINPQGQIERWYEPESAGEPRRAEVLDASGRVVALKYSMGGDAPIEVVLSQFPTDEVRDVIILLDSVPYAIVRDLWAQGRFRLFHPPSRVISPFPVMTDLCFAEFFGTSPSPGVEALSFDGARLRGGVDSYYALENSAWLHHVDCHLDFRNHGYAYLWPGMWFDHELRRIGETRQASATKTIVGYCVATSAYGAKYGRNGHVELLIRLDRFCQQLVHDSNGRIRITLLSDHGHDLKTPRRIPLPERLADFGYRVTDRLERAEDVVVPQYGMVTCAAIYTEHPERVAGDVVGLEGIELATYLIPEDEIVVLSKRGRARIKKTSLGYAYVPEFGDPLALLPILQAQAAQGHAQTDGSLTDHSWFEATQDHQFPDVIHRLWRAFHGLVKNTPSILISTEEGWFSGSSRLADLYPMSAAHGNLRIGSSTAFAMTMAAPLPETWRMQDLRSSLKSVGVVITP